MHTYKLDLESGELYHFGILGQKWGVRRYQNKDGSLTPEGYEHYGHRKNNSRKVQGLVKDYEANNAIKSIDENLKLSSHYGDLSVAIKETENGDITVFMHDNPSDETISKLKNNLHQAEEDIKDIKSNSSKILSENYKKELYDEGYTVGYPKLSDNFYATVRENGDNEYIASLYDDADGEYLNEVYLKKTNSGWALKTWTDLNHSELYHYGTKGMHWGQRRYQNPDGSLTPEGYVHYGRKATGSSIKGKALGILGTAAVGSAIASNAGRKYKYAVKVKDATKNVVELGKELNSSRQKLQKAQQEFKAATFITGKNPTLARKVNSLIRTTNTNTAKLNSAISARDATIAAAKIAAGLTVGEKAALIAGGAAILAGLGYIGYSEYSKHKIRKSAKMEKDMEEKLQHCAVLDLESGELYHWGILGMHWGVRRYQNKDGSLTPEGEIHYGRLKAKLKKKELKALQKQKKIEKKASRAQAKIEVKKAKALKKAKKKAIANELLYKKLIKEEKKSSESGEDKKNKIKEKVSKMITNGSSGKNTSKLSKKDFDNMASIIEYGEKRTHNSLDQFYKDKYVLDAHTKLKTKEFKNMSTKDLSDYINRYETETRFMGAKEKRSVYDVNSRVLKRMATNVGSVVTIAVGVATLRAILSNKEK